MAPIKKKLYYALFRLNFPLRTEEKQIIYIEDKYDPRINQFMEKHYEKFVKLFADRGYDFAYVPILLKKIKDENPDIIQNYRPTISVNSKTKKNPVPQDIYDSLFSFLKYKKNSLKPGFIRYKATVRDRLVFSYFQLRFVSEDDFREQIERYIQNVKFVPAVEKVSYQKNKDDTIKQFGIGINEWILQIFTQPQKLSNLLVTKDYRILLTDYDNQEVDLTPLQKAIYLFFLKHPEGVLFEDLKRNKEELMNIYKKLVNRENEVAMNKSIALLVDTADNSFYEKCSCIREAFKEAFIKKYNISPVDNYCITGNEEHFAHKRIPLDRKFVRIEADI